MRESLSYHELNILIRKKTGSIEDICTTLNNLGLIFRTQGKLRKSIEIYDEALSYDLDNNKVKSYLYSNRGIAYFELGLFDLALKNELEAFKLRIQSRSDYLISDSLFNLIHTTYYMKDKPLMMKYAKKYSSLKKSTSISSLETIATAYLKMIDDPLSALDNWKETLSDESLEFGYKLICYEEILLIYVSESTFDLNKIFEYLNGFEHVSKINNLISSQAKINFIKAIIHKKYFEIEQAKEFLQRTITISKEHGLPYHEYLAKKELDSITEKMEHLDYIYNGEIEPIQVIDSEDIILYIQEFKSILSKLFE